MSAVSESGSRRMTLGDLSQRHGFDLVPPFAAGVTVTSLADDVDSVHPGSLYVAPSIVSSELLEQVQRRGAYAAMVPRSMKGRVADVGMPLLFADPTAHQLGVIADEMAGSPSGALAVFAVDGADPESVHRDVRELADFLHMLGNPVGVVCASDSQSLERYLDLDYPLGILDMQRALAVCAEDGAAAVIIAMDGDTLRADALRSVTVDVVGVCGRNDDALREHVRRTCERYGCVVTGHGHVVTRTEESDALAEQASLSYESQDAGHLSLAIAMTMAAGVRKANIKSALRVSRELR
ncbi:UDP-N-acetylmuramyl peptide synthase [Bifidobacterium phasiani]|uniref:UDP-N-acetylmuramyl peptide synthase n=1 Tax=Bifidobacterium phasiani TaxID=2834431 RepID=A0ABS6WAR4_9BIFI|nr:UDP-N-acetylmuramyl peptide synthase [Bifidobacterium phasiani]MBW3083605.1 UDP-N-acetylmuramyl peptide synthase [Bifidobacterium phasiani]